MLLLSFDMALDFAMKFPGAQTSLALNEWLPEMNTSSLSACTILGRQHGFRAMNATAGLLLNKSEALKERVPHKCMARIQQGAFER